jgi:hypothetical protein
MLAFLMLAFLMLAFLSRGRNAASADEYGEGGTATAADLRRECSLGPPTVPDTSFSPPTNSVSVGTMSSFWPYQQKLVLPTKTKNPCGSAI